jgi:carbon storage regulator
MLVLTRRLNEEIIIDGNIRIVITAISGEKVRIGVSAPPSVRVDRAEIHEMRRESVSSNPAEIKEDSPPVPVSNAEPAPRPARPRTNRGLLHRKPR